MDTNAVKVERLTSGRVMLWRDGRAWSCEDVTEARGIVASLVAQLDEFEGRGGTMTVRVGVLQVHDRFAVTDDDHRRVTQVQSTPTGGVQGQWRDELTGARSFFIYQPGDTVRVKCPRPEFDPVAVIDGAIKEAVSS